MAPLGYVTVGRILSSVQNIQAMGQSDKSSVNHKQCVEPHISQFLPTSRRIVQFSNGQVYLFGCFCSICNIFASHEVKYNLLTLLWWLLFKSFGTSLHKGLANSNKIWVFNVLCKIYII